MARGSVVGLLGRHTRRVGVAGTLVAAVACGGDRARVDVVSPLDREVLSWMEEAFEAAHPGIDLRISTATGADALVRLASGDAQVWLGAPTWELARAASEGVLVTPRAQPGWAAAVPSDLGDPAGRWLPFAVDPLVLAFNPDSLSRGRAPRDWIDLLHYRWAGRLAWPDGSQTSSGAAIVGTRVVLEAVETGDTLAGFDWLTRVDRNVRDYLADDEAVARRVMEGFALVAPLPLSVAEGRRAQGRRIEYRVPESPTPAVVRGVAVAVGAAADPMAVDALLAWLGTRETVVALATRFGLTPVDPGAAPAPPGSALATMVGGLRYAVVSADTLAVRLDDWVERWRTTVQGRAPGVF